MPKNEHLPLTEANQDHHEYDLATLPAQIASFEGLDIYDPEAPATQYLRELAVRYTEPGQQLPEVYVVKGEHINAFQIGNIIAVHDSALQELEYEDEVKGLFGHEFVHFKRGHSKC